jgi:hypothetical protein
MGGGITVAASCCFGRCISSMGGSLSKPSLQLQSSHRAFCRDGANLNLGGGIGPGATSASRLATPEIIERPGLARRVVTVPTEGPKSAARLAQVIAPERPAWIFVAAAVPCVPYTPDAPQVPPWAGPTELLRLCHVQAKVSGFKFPETVERAGGSSCVAA